MIIDFKHNNCFYSYREDELGKDGLYKLIEKSYVHQTIISNEIQTLIDNKIASYDLANYSELRRVEYDKLNQFELIADDNINGTNTHIEAINVIKAKYPKPSEV